MLRVNSMMQYTVRLISQLWDRRMTPIEKPSMEARTMPHMATRKVLPMPTHMARMWVSLELYSMNGENVMSYAEVDHRKSKLKSLPIASRLIATLRAASASRANNIAMVRIWMMTDRLSSLRHSRESTLPEVSTGGAVVAGVEFINRYPV